MKSPAATSVRRNPLTRFLNRTFLFVFSAAGLLGFVAGFIHGGVAILAYPFIAWSPFILFIVAHFAFGVRSNSERMWALVSLAFFFFMAVKAWQFSLGVAG